MTLVVVSDGHIGSGANLGDRLADQRSSWLRVCATAAELAATVLHAGDVFNSRRATPSEMRVWQAGLDVLREGRCDLIVAAGNHDVQSADTPTSVEAASAGYSVYVVREPEVVDTLDGPIAFLPWMPPRMSARETTEALMIVAESLAGQGARLLIAHWAIAGGSLPSGLPLLELAEPMLDPYALQTHFDLVLAGHIHKRQEVIPGVWHIGPLNRTSFGEKDVETGFWRVEPNASVFVHVPDRPFVSLEFDERDATDPTTELIRDVEAYGDFEGAIVRIAYRQTAEQVVDQRAVREHLLGLGAHHIDALSPLIERQQSVRSQGVTEQTGPHESWDAYFKPQAETLGAELAEIANERAHERIAGAA